MYKKHRKQQKQRWTTGQNEPVRNALCQFERQCKRLKLNPENIPACAASKALKNWAAETSTRTGNRRYNSYYFPEALLSTWKFVSAYAEYSPDLPQLSFERAA